MIRTAPPERHAPRRAWEHRGHHLVTEWNGHGGGYHVLYYPDHAADLRYEEIARDFATPEAADAHARKVVEAGNVTRPPVPPEAMTPSRRTYGCTHLRMEDWDPRRMPANAAADIEVSVDDGTPTRAADTVGADYGDGQAPDVTFRFNLRDLNDALASAGGETVRIELGGADPADPKPVSVTGDDGCWHMVMPIRGA